MQDISKNQLRADRFQFLESFLRWREAMVPLILEEFGFFQFDLNLKFLYKITAVVSY